MRPYTTGVLPRAARPLYDLTRGAGAPSSISATVDALRALVANTIDLQHERTAA